MDQIVPGRSKYPAKELDRDTDTNSSAALRGWAVPGWDKEKNEWIDRLVATHVRDLPPERLLKWFNFVEELTVVQIAHFWTIAVNDAILFHKNRNIL